MNAARTQSFILLLFGGALTRLATSDALLRYVRPSSRRWVLLAGAVIVCLSLWNLFAAAVENGEPKNNSHSDVDAHGRSGVSRWGWLVLAPVLAVLVVGPPALGSFSAAREPARVPEPAHQSFPPLPAADPAKVSILNFATRVIWDDARTVRDRRVELTGFVLAGNRSGFVLTRLVITCCAADAQPVNVEVLTADTSLRPNTWVTVTGQFAGLDPDSPTVPQLRATQVRVVPEPVDPYDH